MQARANEKGLQYVKLDGNVGHHRQRRRLVMSTLDVVAQAGARAANFLDVGGGASADQMATSLEVVLSDPAVKAVLINIFGGITRCDLVAQGVLGALERVDATVPIVVRLDGDERRGGPAHPGRGRAPAHRDGGHHAGRGTRRREPRERRRVVSVLIDAGTRLVVQGITGNEGRFHTLRNRAYGTDVVAGVTPGKAGQDVEGIPVFDTVAEAVREQGSQHRDDLRAAALRGARRSSRPPTPAWRWSCASPRASP